MKMQIARRIAVSGLLAATALAGATAAAPPRTVPANTVIRAELDDKLSTKENVRGDRFEAVLADNDRSGLPEGTRFQGVVTESSRPDKDKEKPGVLDVKVQRAILPDGTTVAVTGTLSSLDDKAVRRLSNGRLETRSSSGGKKFDAKWVGYGAAGGAVLSTIFGGNLLKGALLGALGGAAYGYLNKGKGKSKFSDVELDRGTKFGIRLNNRMTFNDRNSYRYASER